MHPRRRTRKYIPSRSETVPLAGNPKQALRTLARPGHWTQVVVTVPEGQQRPQGTLSIRAKACTSLADLTIAVPIFPVGELCNAGASIYIGRPGVTDQYSSLLGCQSGVPQLIDGIRVLNIKRLKLQLAGIRVASVVVLTECCARNGAKRTYEQKAEKRSNRFHLFPLVGEQPTKVRLSVSAKYPPFADLSKIELVTSSTYM